jgi:hypothetical protein
VKTLVSLYLEEEEDSDPEGRIRVCRDTILWATKDNRNYLRYVGHLHQTFLTLIWDR